MEDRVEPLSYARPMEMEDRPPMYCLIWTLIVAGGLIILGLVASVAFGVLLVQTHAHVVSLAPLSVAGVFLCIGIRSLTVAVQFLRGRTPQRNLDRWIFQIWITRF